MKREIKVLMVLANLRVSNGVASYAMNYYRKLNHQSVKMDFAIYSKRETPYEAEINEMGDKVFLLPPPEKNLIKHIKVCNELLNSGHYDIIHDNTLMISYPIMAFAKHRVPVRILHSHNSELGETTKKERLNELLLPTLRKTANLYVACSDLAGRAMFGNSDFDFIPNVIDENKFIFSHELRKSTREIMQVEDKIVIATVGRIAAQKNPFFALDTIDRLADMLPNIEYWWIGNGLLDSQVKDYRKKLQHPECVKLLGSRNDVIMLYNAADIFFLPSIFEGLPVTGIEAQAMGLPCVISDSITKQLSYTDLVCSVPLSESIETWATVLKDQIYRISKRRSYSKELMRSIFSAENAGERLESYYRANLKQY